ncbi:hypothetical protein KPSA3_07452 [Pseudomonas syringae pv. actinidiae]|uniref:Uncharacterized protein n=1 Tax=Pseudomonas syringae pv. actinidiae TaxID=103796 RepID=A0AAN4TPY5_PSESF|nr:hypothetical protein KPSA3_07452 [Pseudomonas syringae pv. actinidiae]
MSCSISRLSRTVVPFSFRRFSRVLKGSRTRAKSCLTKSRCKLRALICAALR